MKEEITSLFKYFDRDNKGVISYHNFMSILHNEHMDMVKISKSMLHYFDVNHYKMSDLFIKITKNERPYLNIQDLDKLMTEIGFYFSPE